MRRHRVRFHESEGLPKRHQCQLCGNTFAFDSCLKRHIKKIHEKKKIVKPKPYKCTLCTDVSFAQASNLKIHIASVHEGKRYTCNFCLKTYQTEAVLHTHIETIHIKSQVFKCEKCEGTFTTKATLVYHAEVCGKMRNAVTESIDPTILFSYNPDAVQGQS